MGWVRWRWLPDFVGYTRQEFRDHYGADGDRIWHESDGVRCGCDSPDEKRFAFDVVAYTELEFRGRYGADGLRFWHEAQDLYLASAELLFIASVASRIVILILLCT